MTLYIDSFTDQLNNWKTLLETPPDWSYENQQPKEIMNNVSHYNFSDEVLTSTLQPSTFNFLEEEIQLLNIPENTPSKGTFAIKMEGFVADSIKFEYYYNEIPSRCLMLSNISPNATRDDLIYIFNYFGQYEYCDLEKLSSGVASVQFYNMEDAQMMRVSNVFICNKKVTSIFHIESQVNPNNSKCPPNNGTIVLFHLPRDISENMLMDIFSQFGKIRQIRHTPSKDSQKFIEFYDTRAAEKALKALNGKPLNKKYSSRVSIEYSLPGGFKKNIQKYYRTTLPTIVRNNNTRVSY
ncbi:hypothetical protein TRFO_15329 [Tritrichomonas foetus]|uniref:RRM domain-containing protein n=1 Tax=Tritrichomonas foetus TaxID=1144522 RepID=A0A1J4KT61_9EUKA|nr:hypothetical protein TRFO_15329 [Tritrichomonas foetus]|eukprot:OHT14306.1 hypothetical protein TRFO_15329 [Tritrichomonas foetus]